MACSSGRASLFVVAGGRVVGAWEYRCVGLKCNIIYIVKMGLNVCCLVMLQPGKRHR